MWNRTIEGKLTMNICYLMPYSNNLKIADLSKYWSLVVYLDLYSYIIILKRYNHVQSIKQNVHTTKDSVCELLNIMDMDRLKPTH